MALDPISVSLLIFMGVYVVCWLTAASIMAFFS